MSASFPTLHALLVVLSILTVTSNAIEPCERLQSSLLYEQKDAPRDLSGVVRRLRCLDDFVVLIVRSDLIHNLSCGY